MTSKTHRAEYAWFTDELNKDQRWLPPSLKAHTKLKLFNLWFYHSQRLLAVEQRQQEQAASVNG